MNERWKVSVDNSVCQGSGLCAGIAPDHFELDDSYHAVAKQPLVDADPAVLDAAECCPVEAISLTEAETGRNLLAT